MGDTDQQLNLVERIYRARSADLLGYLRRRLRNDADARDIAQEAFLRLLRLDHYERLRNPEAYLFRIASNLIWERGLHRHEESEAASLNEILLADGLTPLDCLVADEEMAQLTVSIEALPAIQRAILVLHLREGLTFSKIAEQTGITTSQAKKQYLVPAAQDGRAFLRRALRPGGEGGLGGLDGAAGFRGAHGGHGAEPGAGGGVGDVQGGAVAGGLPPAVEVALVAEEGGVFEVHGAIVQARRGLCTNPPR
jgi:RNA polymerase sigma-70 factor (ECF subfamily)